MFLLTMTGFIGSLFVIHRHCVQMEKEVSRIPLRKIEERLDEENRALDRAIASMLQEHRALCSGELPEDDEDPGSYVTEELEEKFRQLESRLK